MSLDEIKEYLLDFYPVDDNDDIQFRDQQTTSDTVTFTISFSDTVGNAGTPVTVVSDSSAVEVDMSASITGVSADWGDYLNATEDDSNGIINITTADIEDGQTVTVNIKQGSTTEELVLYCFFQFNAI